MHQPPTIPEGDEENEGVDQLGHGTAAFRNAPGAQQVPPMHDSVATAEELQTREDSGVGYGQTPTMSNEIVAMSGEETTDLPQQAEYHDHPESDDQANLGATAPTDADQEIQGQLNDSGTLAGIQEDEGVQDESARAREFEKGLPTLVESPIPPADVASFLSPRATPSDGYLKPDESHHEERRRSAKSGRDRSAKGQPPQVEFEKFEHEEEQDIVPEEPEIRLSREELLNRHQAAEMERDRLKGINIALQQRLADYLHKRKGADDIPALAQGNDRTNSEQQQRYQKYLNEIESLQERIKRDQLDYERKHNEYEQQIQRKKGHVEHLKSDYVKLVKEIASKAVFSRSGKSISNQEVENYLASLREKEEELIKARHENIRLKNQLRKRESQLKSKEELAEGLHMIDFEQLKIENQTYSEKIEERNEELMKLRKKISTTVQILSHIKEKLAFVQQQRDQAENILGDKESEVKQKRDELATIKRRRDRLRQENQSLKQNSGLIGNEQLLRDYEERYDDIERCTEKLEGLKKRHAEVTLMCKVLKKKIAKV